jgi:hypothetical protein
MSLITSWHGPRRESSFSIVVEACLLRRCVATGLYVTMFYLFVAYLTTLSVVARKVHHRIVYWLLNNGLEGMWKGEAVT